jgi:cell division protein FtsZ
MIELTRTHEVPTDWKVKVLGVGGAGTHAVDRLNRDGLSGVEMLVANTDVRALNAAFTADRISLGQSLTRGLGAGGDPELGRTAALESIGAVGERLMGASLVILMVGLGGGTGSGAAPCIAQIARSQGAHVAVFATLPFSFEGRRRREQALEAVDALRREADLVICFENDRMPTVADPASGIEDAFQAVDSLLAQSVRAIAAMTRRRNVLHSGLDEIAATVAGHRSTALFGYGAADGEERARAAVARAFANPLLNFDQAVHSFASLWVYVAGGPDMRFSEVQNLMQEVVGRLHQEVRLYFGAAVDPQMGGAVSVTLLAGVPSKDVLSVAPASREREFAAVPAPVASQPVYIRETPTFKGAEIEVPELAGASEGTFSVPKAEVVLASAPLHEPVLEQQQRWGHAAENESETVSESLPPEPMEQRLDPVPVESHVEEPVFERESPPAVPRNLPIPPFELSKERRREAAPATVQQPVAQPVAELPHDPAPFEPATSMPEPDLPARGFAPEPEPARGLVTPPVVQQSSAEPPVPSPDAVARKAKENVQEQMRFEPVNRGRFEKTDPTIVDGEDLDVPTFMRQGVSLEP